MVSKRRLFNFLTILIFVGLFMVACERPLGDTNDEAAQTAPDVQGSEDVGGTDDAVEDAGGETAVTDTTDSGEEDAATDDTVDDSAEADSGDTAEDLSGEEGGGAGDADSGEASDSTDTDVKNDEEEADESTDESDAAADTADEATTDSAEEDKEETAVTTNPATHTVAAGENLFRIGLKYNLPWVDIANENNLANPHILSVGQELKLPGATTTTPSPEPTPSPQTETTYIVKAGDNLYRIGLSYGISWVQIAEANGLDSPNMIVVGSELKIPVNTPGPAPQFTHAVQPGETLFLISLQYGVTWPAIAEANELTSPYVIYVGQTLEIPGAK
ncbi:Membrane-bound lytic murein transglycosylase D precursor [hydrothermal vent metagenome]|uniref:Membrane-bound lytic murein transglycosylase D n=1 Tax=hydrothermal vent metagenome TaxID=652676 RepID=A0A3B0VGZ8_9ZZZZ